MFLCRLLLLLTAALKVTQSRRLDLEVPHEEVSVRTDTQLLITYPRGEDPHLSCSASPHLMGDESMVAGSVVAGLGRLQELDVMARLTYADNQLVNCSLVPPGARQNELDSKALDPSWCLPCTEGGTSASQYVCPDRWHLIETRCFLVANASGTWNEGLEFCGNVGGSLATVSSKFQQAILMLTLNEDTWIGLKNLEDHSYIWADGSPYTFTSWAEGKPSSSNVFWLLNKKCVMMRRKFNYLWSNDDCDDVKQFLCSIQGEPIASVTPTTTTTSTTTPTTTTTTTTTSAPEPACVEGWQQYESSCYLVSEVRRTWWEAQAACDILDGVLVSVTTEREHIFLTELMQGSTWIGLSDQYAEGNYTWEDQSTYDFARWGDNEPNNGQGILSFSDENCVEMRRRIGYLWNDEPCDESNWFICERPIAYRVNNYNTVS